MCTSTWINFIWSLSLLSLIDDTSVKIAQLELFPPVSFRVHILKYVYYLSVCYVPKENTTIYSWILTLVKYSCTYLIKCHYLCIYSLGVYFLTVFKTHDKYSTKFYWVLWLLLPWLMWNIFHCFVFRSCIRATLTKDTMLGICLQ